VLQRGGRAPVQVGPPLPCHCFKTIARKEHTRCCCALLVPCCHQGCTTSCTPPATLLLPRIMMTSVAAVVCPGPACRSHQEESPPPEPPPPRGPRSPSPRRRHLPHVPAATHHDGKMQSLSHADPSVI
jgi:hypothetical protein